MAKRRATPGTRQINIEMAEGLRDELARYADGRGESVRQVIERAARREMDNPPPPPVYPPLPPVPAPVVPPKVKGKRADT